jgi:cytochrome c peroxidase
MRRDSGTLVKAAFAAVLGLGISAVPHPASAQFLFQPDIPVPPYNPYPALPGFTPPSILPPDLQPEIYRVRFEVESIFSRYFEEYQALTPLPTYAGNPPILVPNGYQAQRILGGLLNYDETISPFNNTACASCHMPYVAFSGPIPSVNLTMVAYPGSYRYRAAKRTAQRYTYSHTFPVLNLNTTQDPPLFFGGNFWDGRATGMKLQAPDAEQAQGPPVDPLEMGNPDTACIAYKISQAPYRPLFELVWGTDFDITWPSNVAQVCATPNGAFGSNTTPVTLSATDRTKANNIYDHWGQSLSFLERSTDISPFNSKFDFFLAGKYTLTADEMAGFQLFNGKGNCNSCHVDGRSTLLTPGQTDTGNTASVQPLFTCHGFANEGLPLNPRIALFYESTPDIFGFTPNPDGFQYRDLLLGNFLRSGPQSFPNPNQPDWLSSAPTTDGQAQVMTARDVAMTPPQCPTTEAGQVGPNGVIPFFQKEFFHNGYIKSLKQLVHFYNTRDSVPNPNGNTTYAFPVTSGHCPPGTVERVTCWPQPEVLQNIDMTTGALGLTDTEENQIVAFLQALTDGFNPANPTVSTYKNIDTFTGQCSPPVPGETASNQGNSSLIPTWSLAQFPCAADICGVAPFPSMPIP